MAEFDFQKLGTDRFSQNLKRAITSPVGNLTVGDITKGLVQTVTFDNETGPVSVTTAPRRTGAILINVQLDSIQEIIWTISGTTLSAELNGANTGTLTFWVF